MGAGSRSAATTGSAPTHTAADAVEALGGTRKLLKRYIQCVSGAHRRQAQALQRRIERVSAANRRSDQRGSSKATRKRRVRAVWRSRTTSELNDDHEVRRQLHKWACRHMNQNKAYTRRTPSNTTSTPPSNGWTMVPQRRKTTATKQRRQHILPVQTKPDPIPASPNPYASLASTATSQSEQEDTCQRRAQPKGRPNPKPTHSTTPSHNNKHVVKHRARAARRQLRRQQTAADDTLLARAEIEAEDARTAIAKGNSNSKIRRAVDKNHQLKPSTTGGIAARFLRSALRAKQSASRHLASTLFKTNRVQFATHNTTRHFDTTAKPPIFLDRTSRAPMKAGKFPSP